MKGAGPHAVQTRRFRLKRFKTKKARNRRIPSRWKSSPVEEIAGTRGTSDDSWGIERTHSPSRRRPPAPRVGAGGRRGRRRGGGDRNHEAVEAVLHWGWRRWRCWPPPRWGKDCRPSRRRPAWPSRRSRPAVNAPAPPAALPPNIWDQITPRADQCAACKAKICNSRIGQLLNNMLAPVGAMTRRPPRAVLPDDQRGRPGQAAGQRRGRGGAAEDGRGRRRRPARGRPLHGRRRLPLLAGGDGGPHRRAPGRPQRVRAAGGGAGAWAAAAAATAPP